MIITTNSKERAVIDKNGNFLVHSSNLRDSYLRRLLIHKGFYRRLKQDFQTRTLSSTTTEYVFTDHIFENLVKSKCQMYVTDFIEMCESHGQFTPAFVDYDFNLGLLNMRVSTMTSYIPHFDSYLSHKNRYVFEFEVLTFENLEPLVHTFGVKLYHE